MLLQGHESAAGVPEGFRFIRGRRVELLFSNRSFNRGSRDLQKLLLLGGSERELSALAPVLLVLFFSHQRHRSIADHAALISCDVS